MQTLPPPVGPMARTYRILFASLIIALMVSSAVVAQTSQPAETTAPEPTAVAVTPLPAPKTIDAANEVRALIEQRKKELADQLGNLGQGKEASSADKQIAATIQSLIETLTNSAQAVDAYIETLRRAATLGSADAIAERSQQIEEYKKRTEEIQAQMRHVFRSESSLAEQRDKISQEYIRVGMLADTTNKQQTSRRNTLSAYPQREQQAAQALAEARAALDKFLKEPTSKPADMDSATVDRIRHLRARRLAWQVFQANMGVEQLAAEKVVINLEMTAADAVLPSLIAYARALGDYRSRLDKLASQSEVERIASELEAADTPALKAYWSYRQIIAETRQKFTSRIDAIRAQFQATAKQNLPAETERISQFYTRLEERLARTTGAEKTAAYRRLGDQIKHYTEELEAVRARLDEARRSRDTLLQDQDVATERLDEANDILKRRVSEITDPDRRQEFDKLTAELAADYRPKVESVMAEVINWDDVLISRLEEQEKELSAFLQQLHQHSEWLFWSYTTARGPSAIGKVRAAYAEIVTGVLTAGVLQAWAHLHAHLDAIAPGQYVVAAFVVIAGALLGVGGGRRLLHYATKHEEAITADIEEGTATEVRFTDRFRIQMSRVLGFSLPVALPTALLLLVVGLNTDTVRAEELLARRLLWFLLAAMLSLTLIGRLFRTGKPRFRIIPCSNVVAEHYRFWLRLLWRVTVVLIPPVIVLSTLDIAPAVDDAVWMVYSITGLTVVMLMLRHRKTAVRIVGRGFVQRRPILFGVLVRLYPLLLLVIFAFIVIEFAGYSALVTYVVRNVIYTVLILSGAVILADLLRDVTARYSVTEQEDAPVTASAPAAADLAGGEFSLDDLLASFESRELRLVVTSVATLLRWFVWIGALLWVFVSWGVTELTARQILAFQFNPRAANPIELGQALAAILVFLASFKVSRGVRAMLNHNVYPAYHVHRAAQATINTLLHYTLLVLGFYISLRLLRINLGAIAVMLGGLGLGLGLGLQPLLINFVSGLILFAERHVKVGDLVDVSGEVGEVVGISMRSTQIKSFDNIDMVIPNSEFITAKVINWTLQDTRIRGKLDIGVSYSSDPEKVRDLLLDIANKQPSVLAYPEPVVWFVDFGDNALKFTLAAWFPTARDRWFGMIDMRYTIAKRFKEEGIDIPFPQRTISLHPSVRIPGLATGEEDEPAGDSA